MIYQLKCPVDHTVWGVLKTQQDLINAIAKSGQPFGVDESGPACETIPAAPCNVTYYQYLGFGSHKGIDIPVAQGTEIRAAHTGKVSRISDDVTQGIGVVIYDPIQKIESVYWHLLSHNVKLSEEVRAGDLIGLSDNTGYSKGNHLHFQVNLTSEFGKSLNAIDPMPYFIWEEIMSEQEVKWLYDLAFYREPDAGELAFWSGKPLEEFLKTAIKDRATFLLAKVQ